MGSYKYTESWSRSRRIIRVRLHTGMHSAGLLFRHVRFDADLRTSQSSDPGDTSHAPLEVMSETDLIHSNSFVKRA